MRLLFDFVYLLAAAAIAPCAIYRMVRHKRYLTGWPNRFGKIRRKDLTKKCIWMHAVSVGEVNASRTIIDEVKNRFADYEIVISTTTDTGFVRANAIFADEHTVCFFPFDLSWIIQRAFKNIQPSLCLFMELEVWPNFVDIAKKLNVPVVVVNGRISQKSFAGYKTIKPIARSIFKKLTLILAQTDEYARRFKEIGCVPEQVFVTGSLKYDTAQIADRVESAGSLAAQLNIRNERLWVAGGTGNEEEKILLEVYKKLIKDNRFSDLHLVIVPRKPERFDEVAELIKQNDFDLLRYSRLKGLTTREVEKLEIENRKSKITPVILGDTMGDLRKFYSLATIIFVGRSLVPMGGSDMIEAAALCKCTIFGPHAFNFQQTVDALLQGGGAIMVKDEKDLYEVMQKCLSEPDFAQKIARAGREVIKNNQGATRKTVEQIGKLLKAGE